jgi:hypothetical protein
MASLVKGAAYIIDCEAAALAFICLLQIAPPVSFLPS